MPLHAQIACIGGNALFALLFAIAAQGVFTAGDFGLGFFILMLAVAAGYTCWVLLKFRNYLSAEAAQERELHIEKLKAEIEALRSGEHH